MAEDSTDIHHWNIPIPMPINLGDNRHGVLHLMGETFRNPQTIQAKVYFCYGDLVIVLWKASKEVDRFDFRYYPQEIWDKLSGDKAFQDMIPRFMTYEMCMARTKKFDGDTLSFEEFQKACLGMAPPPVEPETVAEDIDHVKRSLRNLFRS